MPTEKFDLRAEELKKAKNLLEGIRAIKQYGGELQFKLFFIN